MEATAAGIDKGDTAWLLISTALVMLMTPGLALFYGGMVQGKNVLSTFMHSFFALALVTLQWTILGYSLSFGRSHGGVIGGFEHVLLDGVGSEVHRGTHVPELVFMAYQGMFAAITPALISGAFAERMKFSAFVIFTLAWTTLVYDPVAHWVWGAGGWLANLHALDFAGGTVVHLASGASALVAAFVVGKRVGHAQAPHNLTMTLTGAGLLWFGWFGFNAGSALDAGGLAAIALVNTHVAAAAGAVAWAVVERQRIGKVTALGVASGLVAGLVGITPAAGYVTPTAAIIIGVCAGAVCYGGVMLKGRFGYDDALDAFGVHGVGGALGALLTGVFARASVNGAGADGALLGNWRLVGVQAIAVGATMAYAGAVSWALLQIIDKLVGLRVDKDGQREGLDAVLHGESGYVIGASSAPHRE